METPHVLNIQRFCLHDGDGIRTTVFFKGCPISCLWCHNPEGQGFSKELMFFPERCAGCGACAPSCPKAAISMAEGRAQTDRSICDGCGECISICPMDARAVIGEKYTVTELMNICLRDMQVYETSGGGVTLSGGEVMSQPIEYICELASRLRKRGVNVSIDTCGFAPWEKFEAILPHADCFLYDIKHIDPKKHMELAGADNALILENLTKLGRAGANIHVRIPVIDGANGDDDSINAIIAWIKANIKPAKLSLLPYHAIGSDKYSRLGMEAGQIFSVPSKERMEQLAKQFEDALGLNNVNIGG